jgi:hypothetical protein
MSIINYSSLKLHYANFYIKSQHCTAAAPVVGEQSRCCTAPKSHPILRAPTARASRSRRG